MIVSERFAMLIALIDFVTAPSAQLGELPHLPQPAPPQIESHGSPAPSQTYKKQTDRQQG